MAQKIPAVTLGVVIGFALAALVARLQTPPRPGLVRPPPTWFPVGEGEVSFLGDATPFEIVREGSGGAFRIVEPTGAAFENRRLGDALRSFLREKLAGLRAGDSIDITFRTDERASWRRGLVNRLVRKITFEEERRGGEVWYRASRGPGDDVLVGRTVEEAKEKASREIAREAVAFFGAEPLP